MVDNGRSRPTSSTTSELHSGCSFAGENGLRQVLDLSKEEIPLDYQFIRLRPELLKWLVPTTAFVMAELSDDQDFDESENVVFEIPLTE